MIDAIADEVGRKIIILIVKIGLACIGLGASLCYAVIKIVEHFK